MKKLLCVLVGSCLLAACGDDSNSTSTTSSGSLTKAQAAAMGGKSDSGEDLCDTQNWYGDGECDTFCINADEDCDAGCVADSDCAVGQACVAGVCDTIGTQGCGGIAGLQCAAGQYCKYETDQFCGAADQLGTCEDIPEVCTDEYMPVCGCDGTVYPNACDAAAAGVSVTDDANCGTASCAADSDCAAGQVCQNGMCVVTSEVACGGRAGDTCTDTEYCDFTLEQICGRADAQGVCKPRPQGCPDNVQPVCGCDGNTYTNGCEANTAGTGILSEGACPNTCTTDADCGRGESCVNGACEANAVACGARAGNTCSATEFCEFTRTAICGFADAEGVCKPRPQVCTDIYMPVCSCDGTTYSNECDANAAGQGVLADGACKTTCNADSDCAANQACVSGSCESVTNCGGFAGFLCAAGEYCYYPDENHCGIADDLGYCLPIPDACPAVVQPVCGCDGTVYSNACEAARQGLSTVQCNPT